MKTQSHPLKDLYFRWGKRFELEAEEVAGILENAGLIEWVEPKQYIEINRNKNSQAEIDRIIEATLINYKTLFAKAYGHG